MRERDEKRVKNADANVLLQRVTDKGDELTYQESVRILNDISHLVVPVD